MSDLFNQLKIGDSFYLNGQRYRKISDTEVSHYYVNDSMKFSDIDSKRITFGDLKIGDLFTIDEQTYEKVGPLAALECKEKGLVIQFTPTFEVVKQEKMMEGPIYKVELELTESEADELYRDLLDRLVDQYNEYPTPLLIAIYNQLCKQRGR